MHEFGRENISNLMMEVVPYLYEMIFLRELVAVWGIIIFHKLGQNSNRSYVNGITREFIILPPLLEKLDQ